MKKSLANNILFLVPAKGNSTRLKNKNIFNICGTKLIDFTFNLLKKNNLIKNTYVTSDSKIIKKITTKNGFKFIQRPKRLCNKNSSTESAIIHAVNYLKDQNKKFQWVITLPPTSPLRSKTTLFKVLKLVREGKFDTIITVCLHRGYFWTNYKKKSKFSKLFNNASRRQQDRNYLFEETSSVYANKIDNLIKTNSIINGKIGFVKTPKEESLDINDKTDIMFLKGFIKKKNI